MSEKQQKETGQSLFFLLGLENRMLNTLGGQSVNSSMEKCMNNGTTELTFQGWENKQKS